MEFLRIVDSELASPCCVTLIGGSVISLLYHSDHVTSDIDHIPTSEESFLEAVERARRRLPITVQPVGIFTAPYSYEGRRAPLKLDGLTKLTILVPERHDLAIMKIARGDAADLDAIEDIHRADKLSLDTLIERYHETLDQVIGSIENFRISFLAAVARLFGEEVAVQAEERLRR